MKTFLISALTTLVLATGAQATTTIFEDNFNSETLALNSTPSNWTLLGGTVDIVGPGLFGNLCSDGTVCLDMDGSTSNGGDIVASSGFLLEAGVTYTLSFDYSNNGTGTNTLNFGIGGLTETLVVTGPQNPYATASTSYVGAGLFESIFFAEAGSDNRGVVIDNVLLTAAPVPLPASALLLLAGIGGLTAMRRKQNAA